MKKFVVEPKQTRHPPSVAKILTLSISFAFMSSFYAFLEIEKSASQAEVENALQIRALQINPLSLTETEIQGAHRSHWRILHAARATLTDPAKRAAYDASISVQSSLNSEKLPIQISSTQKSSNSSSSAPSSLTITQSPKSSDSTRVCSTCGSPSERAQSFCLVCGGELGGAKVSQVAYAGQLSSPHMQAGPSLGTVSLAVSRIFGWRKVRGTIVTAEAPYTVDNEFILWRFLVKIGFFVFLAWLIYEWASQNMFAVLIGGALVLLVAILAAGIFCMLFGHFIGFLLSAKLFGKEKQIQVRDVRLRDTQLQEHVVRFRGELRAGQVAVGDEIEIWGKSRGGTIMARRGYNFRTRTRISVKYR